MDKDQLIACYGQRAADHGRRIMRCKPGYCEEFLPTSCAPFVSVITPTPCIQGKSIMWKGRPLSQLSFMELIAVINEQARLINAQHKWAAAYKARTAGLVRIPHEGKVS